MERQCHNGQETNYFSGMRHLTWQQKHQDKVTQMHTVGDQQDLADVMRCKVVTIIYLWEQVGYHLTHVQM
jgi:hypothetical protein